jgi:dihydrofolate reductase
MAEKINTMPKLVASTTLGSSDWHDTTVVGSGLERAVEALKQQDGDPLLVAGSRSVVHTLLDAGLVDEINLQVFPLILASGMSLYPQRLEPIKLELISSRPLQSGVTLQSYTVLR